MKIVKAVSWIALILSLSACNELQLAQSMQGTYQAQSQGCGFSTSTVELKGSVLEIDANGEAMINGSFDLSTVGQTWDCTVPSQVGQQNCRLTVEGQSLELQQQGCLIICGPWNTMVALTRVDSTHLHWTFGDGGDCEMEKTQ